MGEIVKTFGVRSTEREKPRRLRFLFDTGSLDTFVKWSAVRGMRNLGRLATPKRFGGLGNGRFEATHLVPLEIRLLGFWCGHVAFVVPDEVLEKGYDVLAGDLLMEGFNIKLDPKNRDVILDKSAILFSLRVRRPTRRPSLSSSRR